MNERLEDYELDYLIDSVNKDLSQLTCEKNKNAIIIKKQIK